ncbi:MAG TPA: hypothetical protein VH475_08555 [Tepidisphaeraceae bacterium]
MSQPAPNTTPSPPSSAGYEVARPRGQCVVCQAQIQPTQPFMAALKETPTGFERLDVCLNCWPGFDRNDLIGFWRTTMPLVEQKRKLFVDDEVLCQLFERLAETTEPAKLNFRFVLGLILMRKRLIVYENSRTEEGREIWQVRFKGKDEILDLLNPKLDESQIQDVSNQLGEILNEEL